MLESGKCVVQGCARSVYVVSRGMCSAHYQRWRKRGTTDDPQRPGVAARLLEQRSVNGDGCWIWTGGATEGSPGYPYGEMSIGGKPTLTHRLAYETWVGSIPKGYDIDHVRSRGCKSTLCFNPEHLEAVTHRENLLRGVGVAATNARKTHCLRGHPFDEANTYYPRAGGRSCRACRAMRMRNTYAARNR